MSKWTTADIPDQTGRVAVITGSNTGLGFETAAALAEKGAQVVLAVRNLDKGKDAATLIARSNPNAVVALQELDLTSMDSIRDAAEQLRSDHDRIDLLINNAGVMFSAKSTTQDGFELQFGTNHLGHFVLTGLLLDALAAADGGGRVVTVASKAHHGGSGAVVEANAAGPYKAQQAYANSKLANLLFAAQLDRDFAALAQAFAIPGELVRELFAVQALEPTNPKRWRRDAAVHRLLGARYYPLSQALEEVRRRTVRASSRKPSGDVPNGFSYTTRASLARLCWPRAFVSSPKAEGGTAK